MNTDKAFVDPILTEVKNALSSSNGTLQLPCIIGLVVDQAGQPSDSYTTLHRAYLDSLTRRIDAKVGEFLEIHEVLVDGGNDENKWRNFGGAGKACVLADYSQPAMSDFEGAEVAMHRTKMRSRIKSTGFNEIVEVKAFALEGSDGNFVVLLANSGGDWSVHLRQYWESIHNFYRFANNAAQRVHSVEWAIEFASKVAMHSDDVPGVHSPRRPSLASFSIGNFKVGSAAAGIGLRYGDSRDAGFVLSLRSRKEGAAVTSDITTRQAAPFVEIALSTIDRFTALLKLAF